MSSKQPIYAWRFTSSSGDWLYKSLLYDDHSMSCDCPGWTRRVAADGSRSCKHIRSLQVDGNAGLSATVHGPVGKGVAIAAVYHSAYELDGKVKSDPITVPTLNSFKQYPRKFAT